jgi:hypothetical protein
MARTLTYRYNGVKSSKATTDPGYDIMTSIQKKGPWIKGAFEVEKERHWGPQLRLKGMLCPNFNEFSYRKNIS